MGLGKFGGSSLKTRLCAPLHLTDDKRPPRKKTQQMPMEQKQWGYRKPYSTALALLLSSQIGSVSIPQRLRYSYRVRLVLLVFHSACATLIESGVQIPQRLRYSYRVRLVLLVFHIAVGGLRIGCQVVALCAVLFTRLHHLRSACATRV